MGRWTTTAALAAMVTWGSTVQAQGRADLARAEEDFKQALVDEQAGAWEKALGELAEAGTLAHKETPQLLYHRGLCHAKVGSLVLARQELLKAAERAGVEGLVNVMTLSKAQLAEVQPRIASLAVTPPARGAVTSVTVDGIDVTAKMGQSIELDPGTHQVHVTYADAPAADMRETLGDGERRALPIPEPRSTATAEPTASPSEAPHPSGGSGKAVGWILLAGGAALGVGGAIFWGLRDGAISTLKGDCGPAGVTCPASDQSVISRGKLDDAVAVTLWSAAGAAVLGGAGLLLFGGHSREATAAGAKVETAGSWRVEPLVGTRGGGLLVRGALW